MSSIPAPCNRCIRKTLNDSDQIVCSKGKTMGKAGCPAFDLEHFGILEGTRVREMPDHGDTVRPGDIVVVSTIRGNVTEVNEDGHPLLIEGLSRDKSGVFHIFGRTDYGPGHIGTTTGFCSHGPGWTREFKVIWHRRINPGKGARRINVGGSSVRRIDPRTVAEALGAEIVPGPPRNLPRRIP